MKKSTVYLKFIVIFVAWVIMFFLTKHPAFKDVANIYLNSLNIGDICLLCILCIILSGSYMIKMASAGKELYSNPTKIYDYMNYLSLLMVVQILFYVDIKLLSEMIVIKHEKAIVIVVINLCACAFFWGRKLIEHINIVSLISFLVTGVFVVMSSGVELIFIDVVIFLFYIQNMMKVDGKNVNIFGRVYVFALLASLTYYIHLLHNMVVLLNFGFHFVFIFLKKGLIQRCWSKIRFEANAN